MGTSKLSNRQHYLHVGEGKYSVYFSHGDKYEVMASSEEEAKARAKTQSLDWCGYCTRAVRLYDNRIQETQQTRAGEVRGLFCYLHRKTEFYRR